MQASSKAALLALGLTITGTAMGDQYILAVPCHIPNTLTIRITQPTAATITQLIGGSPQHRMLGRTPPGIRGPHIRG